MYNPNIEGFKVPCKEMDVNAGSLTEGVELAELARQVFDQMSPGR